MNKHSLHLRVTGDLSSGPENSLIWRALDIGVPFFLKIHNVVAPQKVDILAVELRQFRVNPVLRLRVKSVVACVEARWKIAENMPSEDHTLEKSHISNH